MQKRKFLTWILCLCLGFYSTHAADFGIRAGLNFSGIPSAKEYFLLSTATADYSLEVPNGNYTGFHFGVFTKLSFANVFIQPEFLFEETRQEMLLHNDRHTPDMPEVQSFAPRFSTLKIPVTAGIKLAIFRFGIGPYFAYMLDNTRGYMHLIDYDERITFHYNESRAGYQILAGIKIGNLSLDYRFEGSFSYLGHEVRMGETQYDFSIRPRQHVISLGIVIF